MTDDHLFGSAVDSGARHEIECGCGGSRGGARGGAVMHAVTAR